MKRFVLVLAVTAAASSTAVAAAPNGPLKRACLQSDRDAKSVWLCGCIQYYADRSLTRAEQRLAASFFKDPHKAQEIRQSDRSDHERFWLKYKEFGGVVADSCVRE